jgi:hypothetical protein
MRRAMVRAILPVAAALLLGAVPAVAAVSRVPSSAPDRFTPLIQSVATTPRWFVGTDGRVHLVYELQLLNGFPMAVTIKSVTVRNAAGGASLDALRGQQLRAQTSLLSTPTTPAVTVPASAVAIVWFDIALRNRAALPATIVHTVTVTVPPGLPVPRTLSETGGRTRVDRRPPVVIGPPLLGPGWVALGSCCDGAHRRAIQPVNGTLYLSQRFAIDWNGVDANDRFVVGDPNLAPSWVFYGRPVIAVANATVVEAVDRFPDQTPNHPRPVGIAEADGNHLILALGDGRFAFYAHLKPGSITVRPGDHLRRGQIIAQLGNSGSSNGPHLHFQVMDRPSALAADGLPFVIDRFRFDGEIQPLDASLEGAINAGKSIPVDRRRAGARRDQVPLGRAVVSFAGG